MEKRKVPPIERSPASPETTDWNTILRNSFLFSQGDSSIQSAMFWWLATGPLYGQQIDPAASEAIHTNVGTYASRISERGHHVSTGEAGTRISSDYGASIAGMELPTLDEFQQRAFVQLSPRQRAGYNARWLNRTAEGFIERDEKYLSTGRPVSGGRRDPWSSFIIDFGILQKGDGFFTWNGTPQAFKDLWEEVMPIIRESHTEKLRELIKIYLLKHPDLPEEDRQRINSYIESS